MGYFDTPREAVERLFNESKKEYDSYKANNEFYALVVSNGTPVNNYLDSLINGNLAREFMLSYTTVDFTEDDAQAYIKSIITSNKNSKGKYAFQAKLLGKNSPHRGLPTPCFDYIIENAGPANIAASTAGVETDFTAFAKHFNQRLVDCYTTFITTEANASSPRVGDIYRVRLRPSRTKNTTYNMEYGIALSRENDLGKAAKEWYTANQPVNFKPYQQACTRLEGFFKRASIEQLQAAGALEREKTQIDYILEHAESLGHKTWDTPYRMWFFGIRKSSNSLTNKFEDVLGVTYVDENGNRHEKYWQGTTLPGEKPTKAPPRADGVAILVEGQYENAWIRDKHQGKYTALKQAQAVSVFRDNNKDETYDKESDTIQTGAEFGINIHASAREGLYIAQTRYPPDGILYDDKARTIGGWSAGCQVHHTRAGFDEMMALVDLQIEKGAGETFSYTLIDQWYTPNTTAAYAVPTTTQLAMGSTSTKPTG